MKSRKAFNDENSNVSRFNAAKKNFTVGIIYNILSILLNFFSRKIFIKYIGIEYLGINGLFTNVLSLLSMVDLGFGVAMNYTFYKPLADNDKDKISRLIYFYRRVYNTIAVLILLLGIGIMPFLKYIINMEQDIPYLYVYYMVFLSQTVIGYLFIYKSTIISADQKNYIIDKINIKYSIIKICAQIICILLFRNYFIYILIGVIVTLFINLSISKIANKQYPYIMQKKLLEKREKQEIYHNLRSIFIYKLSATCMGSIDNIVMSVLVGTVTVGIYSNYYMAITSINTIITMTFGALTAGVGNIVAKESLKKRHEIFKILQVIAYWLSLMFAICFFFLIDDFIYMWLNEKQFQFGILEKIAISFDLYLGILMRPLWTFRDAAGVYLRTKYIMLIAAILNIFFSFIMGLKLGVAGIIFASSLCRILTYVWYEPVILFKEFFGVGPQRYFLGLIKNTISLIIITFLLCLIDEYILSNIWYLWLIKGTIYFLIISILFFITFRKSDELRYMKDKMLSL